MDYEPIVSDLTDIVLHKHRDILVKTPAFKLYESCELHKDVHVSLTELIGSDKLTEPQQILLNNYQFDVNHLYYEHTCLESAIGKKREKEIFGAVGKYVVGSILVTFALNMSLGGCSAICVSSVLGLLSIPAFNHYFNYKCKVADSERDKLSEQWYKEFGALQSKVLEDLVKYESAQTIK